MKLLLINLNRKTEIRVPQGLLYLASAVHAKGHEVIVHDDGLSPSPEESLQQILSYGADVVGMSVYTIPWQLRRMEKLSKAVKASNRRTWVVWGGWHSTLYYRHIISMADVDVVVRGPGEKSLCQMMDALERGRSLSNIPGLVIRENGKIIETGPPSLDPEYLYPRLNFELVGFDAYLKMHDRGAGILQYLTTRGCRHHCRFCCVGRLYEGCLTRKPKEQVISEMRYLLKRYRIRSIHLSDDNAFTNENEAISLCDTISAVTEGKSVPWRCCARVDTLARLSRDTYSKLAGSGCKGFVVGIESGVDRVLKLMRKGYTAAHVAKVLNILQENGFTENLFFFIFNFTGETEAEALQTLELARRIRLMLPRSDIMLHVYFPGSAGDGLFEETSSELSSRSMSELAEQYYNENIRNYHLAGRHIDILRYYINASGCKKNNTAGNDGIVRRVYRSSLLWRIKHGVFTFPFEYYLSNSVIRRIRKSPALTRAHRKK